MKTKKTITAVVAAIGIFIAGGTGGALASSLLFDGQVKALKQQYSQKAETFFSQPHGNHGHGSAYGYAMHEMTPKLREEAKAYWEQKREQWLENQKTLTDEEKQQVDKAYNKALKAIKDHIDQLFAQWGGDDE